MDATSTTGPRPASPRELRELQATVTRLGLRSFYIPPKATSERAADIRRTLLAIGGSAT